MSSRIMNLFFTLKVHIKQLSRYFSGFFCNFSVLSRVLLIILLIRIF